MSKKPELRKRVGANIVAADDGVSSNRSSTESSSKVKEAKQPMAAWKIYSLLTILVISPRAFQLGSDWCYLQSNMVRPSVHLSDPRQLLIVGTLGSGTVQMSREMKKLGIELGHETSDALHKYARDGTISWIHGIRFIKTNNTDSRLSAGTVHGACAAAHPGAYHSTMFQPSKQCSYYKFWDKCWKLECAKILFSELGCHHRRDQPDAQCISPFRRSLLQVRHPLKTVASLVAKAGNNCTNAAHQLTMITSIFPDVSWDSARTCAQKFALFWLVYNREMKKHVDDWYRVEETTPCEVAALGGFTNSKEVLYEPHLETVETICSHRTAGEGPGHGEEHGYVNRKNKKGKIKITWEALEGGYAPADRLREQVQDLARDFGYRVPQ